MLKVGTIVKVNHKTSVFTGKIEQVIKWENPFNPFNKKGVDYAVRASDDNQLYRFSEKHVSKSLS